MSVRLKILALSQNLTIEILKLLISQEIESKFTNI